jgi:hypothetical protein
MLLKLKINFVWPNQWHPWSFVSMAILIVGYVLKISQNCTIWQLLQTYAKDYPYQQVMLCTGYWKYPYKAPGDEVRSTKLHSWTWTQGVLQGRFFKHCWIKACHVTTLKMHWRFYPCQQAAPHKRKEQAAVSWILSSSICISSIYTFSKCNAWMLWAEQSTS